MARKTVAQRQQEQWEAEQLVWKNFRPRLESANSYRDADALARDRNAPESGRPGRRFYSNLAFFLGAFTPPDGASSTELGLYLELVRRIEKELKEGSLPVIEAALQAAMTNRSPFVREP
jgi:hypothetical protein